MVPHSRLALRTGLDLRVDGFSHKLPLLCRFIFTTLAGLQPDADAFQRVKEALVRQVWWWAGGGACGNSMLWVGVGAQGRADSQQ